MRDNESKVTLTPSLWVLTILAALWLAGCQPAAPAEQASLTSPASTAVLPTMAASQTETPVAAPPPVPQPTAAGSAVAPQAAPTPQEQTLPAPVAATVVITDTPVYGYRVVNVFPHDPAAFTQGLVYQDGIFYEGTGLRGQSTLRRVDPATGQVLQGIRLPDQYFGEGIAILGDRLYQLTWQENTGFVHDKGSFELLDVWHYAGEGWGLTSDGQRLVMSDGSHELRFLDPETLQELGRVAVVDAAGQPVARLNELEWVEGEVWANIWQTDLIVRIDPATGQVLGRIDLAGLLPSEDRIERVDVLNGIAFDAATGRLFVTGKWWPKLFEIELIERVP